jgi:hypothetical protein
MSQTALRGVENRDEIAARKQQQEQKAAREQRVHQNVKNAPDRDFTFLESSKKHLDPGGDKTAEISLKRAEELIRERQPQEDEVGRYRVQYDPKRKLSIVYSTQNEGRTITIFHIGPGG